MNVSSLDRREAIDAIAGQLPRRSGQLSRLLAYHAGTELPRAMAGALATLYDGPRPITSLAAQEAVAQPTVTRIVERLEKLDLVRRERDPDDGRRVVVSITDAGRVAHRRRRDRARGVLRQSLDALSDEQLQALVTASDALADLLTRLPARAPS